MLFSLFNPPKGKVLRKKSHNAQTSTLSRHPTKKSNPSPPLPALPTTFTKPLPNPPPEITLSPYPYPDTISTPPPSTKSARSRPTRSTSLKKRNSHAPSTLPPLPDSTTAHQYAENGTGNEEEGAKPVRRKSVIRRVLDKRRERIEAGNNYYSSSTYDGSWTNGEEKKGYDPKLGIENLPLRQHSGLHIGSPSQLLAEDRGKQEELTGGRSDLRGEEIGLALSGDEQEETNEKGKEKWKGTAGGEAKARRGGYWGDFPSHSYGRSYGGLSGVGYVYGGHRGGQTSHEGDRGRHEE